MSKKSSGKSKDDSFGGGLTGFLGGLTELVEKLGELADKGKELSGTGELSNLGSGKQLKGVYGFNVKVGWATTRSRWNRSAISDGTRRRERQSSRRFESLWLTFSKRMTTS